MLAVASSLFAIAVCLTAPARGARDGLSQAAVERMIRQAFPDDPARAVCIADHESDGTPHHFTVRALNGVHVGLFQISYTWHHDRGETFAAFKRTHLRARVNIAHARRIYLDARRRFGNGWRPWTTRGLCGA